MDHEEYAILSHSARKRVSTLSAILRVVDALDYNHDGRVLNLEADCEHCNEKIWTVRLYIRSLADLDDELEHAHDKSDLFEKVFNRKLHFVTMH
jgi:exopolyphosphatase/guanosine-5'-triphosphate,3'-diphosphate pyrophosphatase